MKQILRYQIVILTVMTTYYCSIEQDVAASIQKALGKKVGENLDPKLELNCFNSSTNITYDNQVETCELIFQYCPNDQEDEKKRKIREALYNCLPKKHLTFTANSANLDQNDAEYEWKSKLFNKITDGLNEIGEKQDKVFTTDVEVSTGKINKEDETVEVKIKVVGDKEDCESSSISYDREDLMKEELKDLVEHCWSDFYEKAKFGLFEDRLLLI